MCPWRILVKISSAIALLTLAAECCGQSEPSGGESQSAAPRESDLFPYDGVGRYRMDRDDGRRGIQGLTELASRFGAKPYRDLQPLPYDGTWQTERVILRDVGTGTTLVQLTNDPWADTISYFKRNWSANGQYVVFRRHPGMWEDSTATHGPMVVRSDGAALRSVFRQYQTIREHVCSPVTPDLCFAMADGNKLVPCDLKTGNAQRPIPNGLGCWRLKISPDGRYLMGRSELSDGRLGIWIVSNDGAERHEIPVPDSIHDSYRFHPCEKKIMFWYEDRFGTEGFVQCDFDGGKLTRVPVQFDWNHGDVGPDRGAHTNGFVTRIKGDTWHLLEPLFERPGVEYYDDPCHYNGYLTWMPKDQLWVYASRIPDQPYLSEIQSFHAETAGDNVANRFRVCYTGLRRGAALDNPDASPDGTKVLFNSNMLGRLNVYYVVARLPDRPTDLTATRVPSGIRLTWNPPTHHAEVAGYHVFRSSKSGVGFVPVTSQPVRPTGFIDRSPPDDGTTFYAVTAVEHSGLESGLSDEATLGSGDGEIRRQVFVETETASCGPEVWKGFDGLASDLHYLWMRGREGKGQATLAVDLPRFERPCEIWARVKGENGVQFTIEADSKSIALDASPAHHWTWMKFADTLRINPGKCELAISSNLYGSAIDRLVLTDDGDFSPVVSPQIQWPLLPIVPGVQAKPTSPYAVKLAWQRPDAPTFHHYNLYCSREADSPPQQAELVGSPDRNTYCDWGLTPGRIVYYRVTCVDRGGNESVPSASTKVSLPKVDRIVLEKPPADTLELDVPKTDTYVLWLRLKHGNGGDQYLTATMDRGPAATWTCVFDGLSNESWFTYDQWAHFRLTAGRHQLTIDNKTSHHVAAVLLTNDLSYRPNGHLNILSGW